MNSVRGRADAATAARRARALRARAALLRDRRVVAGRAALPRALPAVPAAAALAVRVHGRRDAGVPAQADRRRPPRRGAAAEHLRSCGSSSSCATPSRVCTRTGTRSCSAASASTASEAVGRQDDASGRGWRARSGWARTSCGSLPDTGVCDERHRRGRRRRAVRVPAHLLAPPVRPEAVPRDDDRRVRAPTRSASSATSPGTSARRRRRRRRPRRLAHPTAVKVMGGITADARRKLGRFYQPHNAQLLHVFNGQPHVAYSPSIKSCGSGGGRGRTEASLPEIRTPVMILTSAAGFYHLVAGTQHARVRAARDASPYEVPPWFTTSCRDGDGPRTGSLRHRRASCTRPPWGTSRIRQDAPRLGPCAGKPRRRRSHAGGRCAVASTR